MTEAVDDGAQGGNGYMSNLYTLRHLGSEVLTEQNRLCWVTRRSNNESSSWSAQPQPSMRYQQDLLLNRTQFAPQTAGDPFNTPWRAAARRSHCPAACDNNVPSLTGLIAGWQPQDP